MQGEISQMDGKIYARLETYLQGFKDDFKGEIKSKLRTLRSELHRPIPVSQTGVHNTTGSFNTTKGPVKGISPALINGRKQKGFCFWCGAKYHAAHKCVKWQLYQVLLDT
ncbi:hypothetical protein PVK06_030265 [Gossypium arboreum]|uniref:Uncharacterized protein n=1 Tax=Gossypium arboreum TaxID=29729 RepID=A0ABR0NMU4_GOSAR|nr:hypothetical protein PVK06_030265 [Gossypium arboreum]